MSSLQPSRALACLLVVLAVLVGSGMDVFGKTAMAGATAWQGAALRWIFGLALLAPILLVLRRRPGMVDRRVHLLRMLLNLVGTWCYFEALARLPLSLVVTVFYAEPLLALPLVCLILKERLDWPRLAALALGFGGVLLAAQPQGSADLWAVALALLGAGAWATLLVLTKRFGQRESVLDLMFWLALSTTLLATPLALLDWQPLPAPAWWGFLGVAVCGLLNGLCWLTALKRLDALVMTTLSYLALPTGFAAAMLIFDERPPLATWLGAGLVLLAVALLAYGERRFRLLALAVTPDGAAVPRS
jgi:drug/metabolite transporter (DMT)-like permease